jgi:hypothetical protein
MAKDYHCNLSQCDVPIERRQVLESYRAKRRTWLTWIDSDEDHAIWATLSAMVWDDVSFRTLAHLATANEEGPLGNSLIAEKLINGHVAAQVLAIRRLMDKTKNTISLRRLLTDIRGNFQLFTRENYVCHDGLPYDYEPIMLAEIRQHGGTGAFWGATSGPRAWSMSQTAHEQFDRLSGIAATNRTREDRLPRSLLDSVERWLDESGANDLAEWSHAFLAHAGSTERRKALAEAIVTNDKITEATRVLARATEAISAFLLFAGGRSNALMPTAQFNQFENLEKAILQPSEFDHIRVIWDRLCDERDGSLEGIEESLIACMPSAGVDAT